MPSTLPSELTDAIIDAVALQATSSLGSCACVSSRWLPRSRFHLLSSLQLKPSQISNYVALCKAPHTTFRNLTRGIVLDGDLLPRTCLSDGTSDDHVAPLASALPNPNAAALVEAFALLTTANLKLTSFSLENVDFTLLPTTQFAEIQHHLSSSPFASTLEHLIFRNTTFQNLKQAHTLICVFHKLERITWAKGVTFLRYRETSCIEAAQLPWKAGLKHVTIEGGHNEDVVAIVLAWIAANPDSKASRLEKLSISGLVEDDVPYLRDSLERTGSSLQLLELGIAHIVPRLSRDGLLEMLDVPANCQFDLLPDNDRMKFKTLGSDRNMKDS